MLSWVGILFNQWVFVATALHQNLTENESVEVLELRIVRGE